MRWVYYNPNPSANLVGDCVVRALSLALDRSWDSVYIDISSKESYRRAIEQMKR